MRNYAHLSLGWRTLPASGENVSEDGFIALGAKQLAALGIPAEGLMAVFDGARSRNGLTASSAAVQTFRALLPECLVPQGKVDDLLHFIQQGLEKMVGQIDNSLRNRDAMGTVSIAVIVQSELLCLYAGDSPIEIL